MIRPAGQPVAELNFGVLNHPPDEPRSAGFSDNRDRFNGLAGGSLGLDRHCLDAAAGNTPSFPESLDRLALLRADGPTVAAYDFNYLRQKLQAGASE